jgi:hypothetical protein
VSNGTTPFSTQAGAPSDGLFINSAGNEVSNDGTKTYLKQGEILELK